MPILNYFNEDGEPSPLAFAQVIAVSAYPQDEEKQQQVFASLATRVLLEIPDWETKIPSAIGLLPVLYESPEPAEVLRRMAKHAGSSWAAGEILLILIMASVQHPELQVTPTKVISVLPDILLGTKTYGGDPVMVRPRTLWSAWSKFKPVSHFHAVRQIWLQDATTLDGPEIKEYVSLVANQLPDFLAFAEALRLKGVELRFLDDEETWRPPPGLKLAPTQFEIPPLADEMLEALRRYRPEHSKE